MVTELEGIMSSVRFITSYMLPQEFGDGIMSAIDMFATIEDVEGKMGEKRLVLTLNGKVSLPDVNLTSAVLSSAGHLNTESSSNTPVVP